MEFDDELLDDLLRDSSANKFKKPVISGVTDDFLFNSNNQSARKEKKSALLAELFGPSSTTSLSAIESSLENQDKSAEGSVNNFSTNTPAESGATFIPSLAKSSAGLKSQPSSLGFNSTKQTSHFFEPSNLNLEKPLEEEKSQLINQLKSSQYNFEESPVGLLKQTGTLSTTEPTERRLPASPELKSVSEWSSKVKSQLPATNFHPFPKPETSVTQTLKESAHQPSSTGVIPFTFKQPRNETCNEVLNETNLAIVKEVLENFSNSFCTRLEKLTTKTEGLNEITGCLVELHKCINTASQNYLNNSGPGRIDNGVLENRILVLENRLESATTENASLRVRLDFVENQLREIHKESSRIKLDTETVVESHLKWMREAVNKLDNKICSHSFQSNQDGDETRNKEHLLRQTQEKLLEFEDKLVKNSASGQQKEILQLLKAELKWLERQKGKLKNDRIDLQVFEKKIQGKLQLLDGLSAEISRTAHQLQSQSLAAETRIHKMEQLWTQILNKEEEIRAMPAFHLQKNESKNHMKNLDGIEDFGLALWKLHVKGDEQKLMEQHNFLQMLNRTVI